MTFLVQDLLDYAHIKSKKFKQNINPFNVIEMVDKVMDLQKDKADAQGLLFTSEFVNIAREGEEVEEGRHSPVIHCDEQRIMQVMLSIQSNALKFTKKGSVKIRVEIEDKEEGQFIKVSVIDTGVGIPNEDQDKLFKLFGFI